MEMLATAICVVPFTSGVLRTNIGELIFNMLVLVGSVKMADRIVREMMGL